MVRVFEGNAELISEFSSQDVTRQNLPNWFQVDDINQSTAGEGPADLPEVRRGRAQESAGLLAGGGCGQGQ